MTDTRPTTIVVELKYPIEIAAAGGAKATVASVTLRRIKAKDLQYMPQGVKPGDTTVAPAAMIPLVASVTGLSVADVGEMDLDDLIVVSNALSTFSAGSPGTGSASSGG